MYEYTCKHMLDESRLTCSQGDGMAYEACGIEALHDGTAYAAWSRNQTLKMTRQTCIGEMPIVKAR
jgi:hypothetical protein